MRIDTLLKKCYFIVYLGDIFRYYVVKSFAKTEEEEWGG